jgi:hypothetical protein
MSIPEVFISIRYADYNSHALRKRVLTKFDILIRILKGNQTMWSANLIQCIKNILIKVLYIREYYLRNN